MVTDPGFVRRPEAYGRIVEQVGAVAPPVWRSGG
jgi:hypothetical protein